jgi:hypothetical protein
LPAAFSNRQYLLWLNFALAWNDPADDADYVDRTRKIVRDLGPWVGHGTSLRLATRGPAADAGGERR